MEPRLGRLYANAVLRPLAEQVLDGLDVRPGDSVCDLMCDGGTMGVALGRAVGSQGRVMLVDTEVSLLEPASRDVSATGCSVATHLAAGAAPSLGRRSFDRVASLLTFGFCEDHSLLDVAERATRAGGLAAVLTWDAAHPPGHEVALADALRDVADTDSTFISRCLATPDAHAAAGWNPTILNDVVRFDGVGTYWAAMVVERPIAVELAGASDETLAAVRAACRPALARWMAADGTLLIPVRAVLWRCGPADRV